MSRVGECRVFHKEKFSAERLHGTSLPNGPRKHLLRLLESPLAGAFGFMVKE